VLVVDDQPSLLAHAVTTLKAAGYAAVATADPAQALRLVESHRFDVVVAGLVMADMSGLDLARRARARYPMSRAVFITGFAVDDRTDDIGQLGAVFVEKPLSMRALVEAVGRAMGPPAGGRRRSGHGG
jgi:DNA-binding NtrC family response regulator